VNCSRFATACRLLLNARELAHFSAILKNIMHLFCRVGCLGEEFFLGIVKTTPRKLSPSRRNTIFPEVTIRGLGQKVKGQGHRAQKAIEWSA